MAASTGLSGFQRPLTENVWVSTQQWTAWSMTHGGQAPLNWFSISPISKPLKIVGCVCLSNTALFVSTNSVSDKFLISVFILIIFEVDIRFLEQGTINYYSEKECLSSSYS